MSSWRVVVGDALERLRELDSGSVQTCVTSPPYFGLRCYGNDRQLGLEATPDEYVARLVGVFREVRRVLRDDGTLWLNLGDSYARNGGDGGCGPNAQVGNTLRSGMQRRMMTVPGTKEGSQPAAVPGPFAGLKEKDLLGIPWMVAFALRADGWYLRSDIIWAKPNPMPESVTDRPTKAHEYVFLLSKSPRYFYDADAVREAHATDPDTGGDVVHSANGRAHWPENRREGHRTTMGYPEAGRNKRSVWTVATQPFPGAHFAVFPPKLIEPCVKAGSAEDACGVCGAPWQRVTEHTPIREVLADKVLADGKAHRTDRPGDPRRGRAISHSNSHDVPQTPKIKTVGFEPSCDHQDKTSSSTVLDPFSGAGTTGLVATRLGRSLIGIELNPTYAEMSRERIRDDAPLMNYMIEVES